MWHHCATEQWFLNHPLRDVILAQPLKCVPYVLHADDAQVSRRIGRTIRAYSCITPCAKVQDPLHGRIALAVWQNDEPLKAMIEIPAKNLMAWSGQAAACNINPSVGPPGIALDKSRLAQANTCVTEDGQRFILIGCT